MIENLIGSGKATVNGLIVSTNGAAIFRPVYSGLVPLTTGAALFTTPYCGLIPFITGAAIFKKGTANGN